MVSQLTSLTHFLVFLLGSVVLKFALMTGFYYSDGSRPSDKGEWGGGGLIKTIFFGLRASFWSKKGGLPPPGSATVLYLLLGRECHDEYII